MITLSGTEKSYLLREWIPKFMTLCTANVHETRCKLDSIPSSTWNIKSFCISWQRWSRLTREITALMTNLKFPIRLRQKRNGNDRRLKQTTRTHTHIHSHSDRHGKRLQHSDDSIHVSCIKMLDKSPHKGHLMSSIVKHRLRAHHSTAETVGSHDHWQIVHIHFVQHNIFWSSKYLFIQHSNNWMKWDTREQNTQVKKHSLASSAQVYLP